MAIITVPVLWDSEGNYLNSSIASIDTTSVLIGPVQKPTKVFPPRAKPTLQTTLEVKTPQFSVLYLNMTLAAWQAAIRASGSLSTGIASKIYKIISESNTIVDPVLSGATLLAVWKDGIDLDPSLMLSGSTITFSSNLENGDVVGVLYSK